MATDSEITYVPAVVGRAPTLEDAKVGAEVLREQGARRVIAYGSIARDEQAEASDIDLAAIFDDIDYNHRTGHRFNLSERVIAATGFDADVILSDFPEWNRRVRNVPTCLEAIIAAHGKVLVDEPPLQPPWRDKEMVTAMSRQAEAGHRLRDAAVHLGSATVLAVPRTVSIAEEAEEEDLFDDQHAVDSLRRGHCRTVIASFGRAYVSALKALLAQHGDVPPNNHWVGVLEEVLPEPHRCFAIDVRGVVPDADLYYPRFEVSPLDDDRAVEEVASSPREVATATAAIAEYAARQYELSFGSCAEAEVIYDRIAKLREHLSGALATSSPSSGEGG